MIRRWFQWGLAALVIAALAFGVLRVLSQRKEQQAADAAKLVQRAQAGIEVAPTDLVAVQLRTLARTVPVSGSLKAANTVVVKARVAGETSTRRLGCRAIVRCVPTAALHSGDAGALFHVVNELRAHRVGVAHVADARRTPR